MQSLASCPQSAELEKFLLGQWSDEDSQACETHISNCGDCQARMAKLAAEDEVVLALKNRLVTGQRSLATFDHVPEEFVNLLVPHLKRIKVESDDATSQVAGSSPQAVPLDSETFVPSSHLRKEDRPDCEEPGTLGRYEIQGVLGTGGMGKVLRGFDPLLQRRVAIKVVHSKWLGAPGLADRLVQEARAAAAVEHDNIVVIHAVEVLEGTPCLVMPLLQGMSLNELLDQTEGPLPLSDILRIGCQAARGLAAAHARGLVHCDIKPANLWLEEPLGRVKILDFGLAIGHRGATDTAGGISGTPGFLAPEQATGKIIDSRADVFSLGCVLYRMATGKPAFQGEKSLRALWTVIGNAPLPAVHWNPQIPLELSQLIQRMIEREPDRRPGTAAEVAQALEGIERQREEVRQRTVRRRWLLAIAGAGVLSGSVVGLWSIFTAPRVSQPVRVTLIGDQPTVSVVLRHEGHEQVLNLGGESDLKLPPGDYFAHPANEMSGGVLVPDHFTVEEGIEQTIRMSSVGEVARHTMHSQAVTSVAVIPGSNPPTVVSVGLDRVLVSWQVETAVPASFVNLPHAAKCMAVSPDGGFIATGGGNKQPPTELNVRIWEARKLLPVSELHRGSSRMVLALAHSPRGDLLASAGADGVVLWNVKDEHFQILPQNSPAAVLALAFSSDGQRLLAGKADGQIDLWDVQSRSVIESRTASQSAIRAVMLMSDAMLAAGDDGKIRIWTNTDRQPRELSHDRAQVLGLAVSPDGRQLVSGDSAGKIRVWSLESGQLTWMFEGHTKSVNSLAVVGSGRKCVSGSADGSVRVWQLPFP